MSMFCPFSVVIRTVGPKTPLCDVLIKWGKGRRGGVLAGLMFRLFNGTGENCMLPVDCTKMRRDLLMVVSLMTVMEFHSVAGEIKIFTSKETFSWDFLIPDKTT